MKQKSAIDGEYCRVAERITNKEELQSAYFTPLTESEAEMLIKHFCPKTDVIFYPDIRASANDANGSTYIRLASNLLSDSDITNKINYPRLQLGVVLHEMAHVLAGCESAHGWKFSNSLEDLVIKTSDDNWRVIVKETAEKELKKKKIAKSISKIVEVKCPDCGKVPEVVSTFDDLNTIYHQLKCGHILTQEKVKNSSAVDLFKSIKGETLYPFQKENNEKFATSNGRLAILDEMGLGKTPSSMSIPHTYNLWPCLIICKSGLRRQMERMALYWGNSIDEELLLSKIHCQIINSSKDILFAGNDFYIVSYDMLPLLKENYFQSAQLSNGKIVPINFKLAIIDECQHIKNETSQRTRSVFEVCKVIPNIVFTSGTPIKNNAAEFFPMLHLLDPVKFPNKGKFTQEFVDSYMKGQYVKYGGIRNYDKFKEATDKYLIRHTQAEVLPDLPEITRNFIYTELTGKNANEYKDIAKEFANFYYNTKKEDRNFFQNILEYFTKMRHITGRAKIDETFDYITDFIQSTGRKITVFTHHIDVREALVEKLNVWMQENNFSTVAELGGGMGDKKEAVKQKFIENDNCKVLIASTLASGEGIDGLQKVCSDCILMERQWNPANEEQAEFRFKRVGQYASIINATYPVALETIDEYFTKLVEGKRMDVKYSLDGIKQEWNQNNIISELAGIIAMRSK